MFKCFRAGSFWRQMLDSRLSAYSDSPSELLMPDQHTDNVLHPRFTGPILRRAPNQRLRSIAIMFTSGWHHWESGIGSDVMKPIAAPIVGGMITSTIHVLILVPVFFLLMKRRELRAGRLHTSQRSEEVLAAMQR
jgi:hypothetical protein